jgi:hypothetical protein
LVLIQPGHQPVFAQKWFCLCRPGQPFYLKNNILCLDLAGFGTIWLDLAGFGGLVNPGLGAVLALVDEMLAEGGGSPRDFSVLCLKEKALGQTTPSDPGIAAKRPTKRKRDSHTPALSHREREKSFAVCGPFRG